MSNYIYFCASGAVLLLFLSVEATMVRQTKRQNHLQQQLRIFQENNYRELRASILSFPTCAALLGVQACVIFWTL